MRQVIVGHKSDRRLLDKSDRWLLDTNQTGNYFTQIRQVIVEHKLGDCWTQIRQVIVLHKSDRWLLDRWLTQIRWLVDTDMWLVDTKQTWLWATNQMWLLDKNQTGDYMTHIRQVIILHKSDRWFVLHKSDRWLLDINQIGDCWTLTHETGDSLTQIRWFCLTQTGDHLTQIRWLFDTNQTGDCLTLH